MSLLAQTPKPPYYAVIFTSTRTSVEQGYHETAQRMLALAKQQPGFLGVESAREDVGITVSYWSDISAIRQWKANSEHLTAQAAGKAKWYESYQVRIAKVEHDYAL